MVDGQFFFDQQVKSDLRYILTLEKSQYVKEMITQLVCLLDYLYFKENYKLIAIDLISKTEYLKL